MSIPGYAHGDAALRESPISVDDFAAMQAVALFGPDDTAALQRSRPILAPQVDAILDVWYGFVGSQPALLEQFSHEGRPVGAYLDRVRARFGQWILDTAEARFDDAWLRWQFEIGRRHHRVGKNLTDGVQSSAVVPLRYLFLLIQPVVHTLRSFLAATGEPEDVVTAMQEAWRKSLLLQITLWAQPYVNPGDF